MSTESDSRRARRVGLLATAVLVGLVVLAYVRTLHGQFLWDDDLHVYKNPTIIGPLGLKEIWTTARADYFPLVLTNFWVQHAIWGLNPVGYHAVTMACHAVCALLLWRVLIALRVPGAWLGAALWALHPVQVESVAWIAELKNTQSGIFFLLAVWFWLKWVGVGGGKTDALRFYSLALFSALLALLSKPSTVMLPVVLLMLTWWRRGEVRIRDLIQLAPFFALSAAASGWTIWEQRVHSGAQGAEWSHGLADRVAIAGKTTWFYLGKLAWPRPLVFIYPRWEIPARGVDFIPVTAVLALLGLLWWRRQEWRAAFVTAVCFVALLFPVLGFFDVFFFRYSFVGDHFQYLASMAPLALAGVVLVRWRSAGIVAGGVLIVALATLSFRQTAIYANNIALWRATVTDNPKATMAWLNLADVLSKDGRHAEAIDCFRRGIALNPGDPDGHSDLGCELVLIGKPAEALPEFATALKLRPDRPETHNNLGNALWYLNRFDESVAEYRKAIELKPDYGEAHNDLGVALAQLGKPEEALPHFFAALRINPNHVEAHDNLGNTLRALGRLPEAMAEHEKALRMRPNSAEVHNNLAIELAASGRRDEAIAHFRRALELRPDFVAASGGLARVYVAAGRPTEALQVLQEAVQRSPKSAAAHNNLGTTFAELGRAKEAIPELETAVRLDLKWAVAWTNLGTALATEQRWADAAKSFTAAARLQPNQAEAHARLAVALVNAGRLEAAVPSFERALQLNPNAAEIHTQLAQVLKALRRNREALEHLEKAADLQRGR